jgi:hypothetical protein
MSGMRVGTLRRLSTATSKRRNGLGLAIRTGSQGGMGLGWELVSFTVGDGFREKGHRSWHCFGRPGRGLTRLYPNTTSGRCLELLDRSV